MKKDTPALVAVRPDQDRLERVSPRTIAFVVVALVVFLYLVRAVLLPFVVSGAIAYLSTPLVERLRRTARMPRWAAASLVFLVVVGVLAGLGDLLVPELVREIGDVATHLHTILSVAAHDAVGSGTVTILGSQLDAGQLAARGVDLVRGSLVQPARPFDLVIGVFSGFVGLLLTIVLLFYFLLGAPQLAAGLLRVVPPKQRPFANSVWRQLDPVLFRYFAGVAVVISYATAISYIGIAYLLHLQNASVLAILTGLLEIIPVVGPATSAALTGFVAIRAATSLNSIILFIIYAAVLRLSTDQLISPLVLGRAARIHPVVIIFAFLAGGQLFGIVGIIVAVPVALAIRIVLRTLYEDD